jgi:hypothetical protein
MSDTGDILVCLELGAKGDGNEMKLGANSSTARVAGGIYLIVVITGIFSLAYVPSKLIVWNNASQTIQNITTHESMYRLSLLSSAVCYLAFLLLPFVLYRLLRSVDEITAKLMVLLAVVSVPISFLNLQNKYAVLTLIQDAQYSGFFPEGQLSGQVMFLLDNYNNGILILLVFWGLWLFPFGYLVFRSGFLPKILGLLLMLGCIAYMISFAGNTMMQNFGETALAGFVRLPPALGEIGTCIWLLLRGINERRVPT